MRFIDAKCVLETLRTNGHVTQSVVDEVFRQVELHADDATLRHIIAHRTSGHPANYHATIYIENGVAKFRVNEAFAREWFVLAKLPATFFAACY